MIEVVEGKGGGRIGGGVWGKERDNRKRRGKGEGREGRREKGREEKEEKRHEEEGKGRNTGEEKRCRMGRVSRVRRGKEKREGMLEAEKAKKQKSQVPDSS